LRIGEQWFAASRARACLLKLLRVENQRERSHADHAHAVCLSAGSAEGSLAW